MINLRYHIVSITAVFLALGIGLAFGASFIEQGTVGVLEENLNQIEEQNDNLEATNSELRNQVDVARQIDADLIEQGLAQLVVGELEGVPVLVLANDGVDDDVVAATQAAVMAAGAQSPGVLRVTDRFVLDDQGEIDDLRVILGLPNADSDQLRVAVTRQVGTLLRDLGAPVPADTLPTQTVVPPLLEQLVAAGFLELDPGDQPSGEFTLVPTAGLRVIGVSSFDTAVPDDDFLTPVLERMVAVDPVRPDLPPPVVVAAQPTVPADIEDPGPQLIDPFRDDEALRERSTTVDDLELFSGLVATVLAVAHGGEGQTGHYGLRDDAQSLLPPALVAPEDG